MRLTEASLSDLIIDLHDQYGVAIPRPKGGLVSFQVVHNNTTYQKAEAAIKALLLLHGLKPINLTVTPGPEHPDKFNRSVQFTVATSKVT